MSIHRADHEAYSLFLAREALGRLLEDIYPEPERSIVISEMLHAIIGHRRRGQPYTVEAGIVRVADALDMAEGRTRIPLEAGQEGIHSISAAAIDNVRISAGEERPVRIEIELNNSAGIFQVDDLLATKIRDTPAGRKRRGRGRGQGRERKAAAFRLSPAGLMSEGRKTGLVLLPEQALHDTGDHPENGRRIEAVVDHLRQSPEWSGLLLRVPQG